MTCPECGHVAPAGAFGTSGASLQTDPATSHPRSRPPGHMSVRVPPQRPSAAAPSDALAKDTRDAITLATGTLTAGVRHPGPADILMARAAGRHRGPAAPPGRARIASPQQD